MRKDHLRCPGQVLYSVLSRFGDLRGEWFPEPDLELFCPELAGLIQGLDRMDDVEVFPHEFHTIRLHELHGIARFSP